MPEEGWQDDAETVPQPDRVIGARYRVVRGLGSGAMGDVYLANDEKLKRRVAVKSIRADRCANEEMLKRIKRECLLHAKIGAHPNIVTLFDLVDLNDEIHLVMEYVEGQSLQEVMARLSEEGNRLPLSDSIEIVAQCLSALTHTHSHGIIHRDIKPGNILLIPNEAGGWTAKVMDFGIARVEAEDPEASTLTRGRQSPGTPLYMSPEQIDSSDYGRVTQAADLYATGVLLYHLIAGHPPYQGTLTEVFYAHLNFIPKPITLESGKPAAKALMAVIERAMKKLPAERYPSAQAFEEAVQGLLLLPTLEGEYQPKAIWQKPAAKWGALAAAALIIALLTLVIPSQPAEAPVRPGDGASDTLAAAQTPPPAPVEKVEPPEPPPEAPKPSQPEPPLEVTLPADEAEGEAEGENLEQPDEGEGASRKVPEEAGAAEGMSAPTPPSEAVAAAPIEGAPEPPRPAEQSEGEPGAASEEPEGEQAPEPAPTETAETHSPAEETPSEEQAHPSDESPPTQPAGKTYTVQEGDTLTEIADAHDLDPDELARWNRIKRPNAISAGQVLYLYEPPHAPTATAASGEAPSAPPATAGSDEDPWTKRAVQKVKGTFKKLKPKKKKPAAKGDS